MNLEVTITGTNSITVSALCRKQTFISIESVMYVNILQKVVMFYISYLITLYFKIICLSYFFFRS